MTTNVVANMENIKKYMPELISTIKPQTEIEMIRYIIEKKPTVPYVRNFFRNHIELMKIRDEEVRSNKIMRSFK